MLTVYAAVIATEYPIEKSQQIKTLRDTFPMVDNRPRVPAVEEIR